MEIDINEVLKIYKEELAAAKDEAILRRAIQIRLEKENEELKQRVVELEKELRGE